MMNRIFRFAAYILILLLVPQSVLFADHEEPPRKVLVLHPSLETGEWVLDFNEGLYKSLAKNSDGEIQVYFKYLGIELVPSLRSMEDIVSDLRFIESAIKPDIVIAVFPSIHSILADNSDILFRDTSKIFIPVISPLYDRLNSLPNSHIIKSASEYAMKTTLDRISAIYPGLEKLLVCSGSGSEDIPYLRAFQNIAAQYADEFSIEYIVGPPLDELFERASALPPDSAVFLLPINRDNNQVLYTTDSIFPKFPRIANAPMFSFSDSSFGHGIVGGNLTSAVVYGEYAGKVSLKILENRDFRLTGGENISKEMYDWRELKRWKISRRKLPEQAEILFKEESFVEKYTYQLLLGLGVLLLQSFWIVSLFVQLKKRRKTEEQLKKSLSEKEILLREIHHRVKNNLAIISSFLALQSINIKDEEIQGLFLSSQNRIRSMALIHELLYRDKNIKTIDLQDYIRKLIDEIIYSYYAESHEISVEIDIREIPISFDTLIAVGLLINEIVSNSMKYAFHDVKKPLLKVSLLQEGPSAVIDIRDNGPGLPEGVMPEKQGSIGTMLITALVEQIGGTLETSGDKGTRYRISFTPH